MNADALAAALAPRRDEMAGVARELVRAGWAEGGAGNLSLAVTGGPAAGETLRLPLAVPALTGRTLLVSGAGTRMRDIALDPLPAFGLLVIEEGGAAGRWLGTVRPTSELAVHLACHDALARAGNDTACLLHTHPTALIALTRLHPRHADLIALLDSAMAEFALVRDRLAVLEFIPPGTAELARASAGVIALRPGVIWPRHGMLATGPTLDDALDIIQLADKAAAVALAAPAGPPARTVGPPMLPGHSLQGRPAPDGIETRYEVRTHDSALAPAEFARLPRRPVHVVLDNIRSAFNVGSVFRLCDACRCAEVIACGYTAHPPHHKLEQAALGATAAVPWRAAPDTLTVLRELRDRGVQVVAVETAENAIPYHRFDYRQPAALVFGNEALGLARPVLELCDGVVEIPVAGYKNSVNVAAAAGIVLYDLCRRAGWLDPD